MIRKEARVGVCYSGELVCRYCTVRKSVSPAKRMFSVFSGCFRGHSRRAVRTLFLMCWAVAVWFSRAR